ncbi:hypothetical protein PG988_005865 [Apiospora saccharicola]
MADTPITYTFVGPTQQRAARIPAAEWKNREPRLRELHSQMTLFDLMGIMEREGFVASRTQYVYQFGKWGLQKYKTAKAAEETPESSGDVSSNISTSPDDDLVIASDHGTKRPRSIQTIDSRDSSSLSSLPSSSKKTKQDEQDTISTSPSPELPSISPDSSSGSCTGGAHPCGIEGEHDDNTHSGFPSQSPVTDWPLRNITESQAATPTANKFSTATGASPTSSWLESILDSSGITGETPMSLDVRMRYSAPTTEQSYLFCLDKATELADDARKSGPKHQLTGTDPNPFHAADYLYAVLNKQRSFRLYARLLEADTSTQQVLSETALACARAAETQPQRNLVKILLLNRLNTEERTASSSERSLANLLLAEIFSLNGEPTLYKSHLASAASARSTSVDASFDVLAYLYRIHPQEIGSKPRVRGQPNQSIAGHMASVSYEGFVQFALGLRYSSLTGNSTEYHDYPGTVVSSCVRSCVDWCAISVDITLLDQPFDTDWLTQESSYLTICRWPEVMALYNYLYRKWRSDESDGETKLAHWEWTSSTRAKLGISTAELLIVCCDMITQACEELAPRPGVNNIDNLDRPYAYLRKNIRITQGLTDEGNSSITGSRYDPTIASSLRSSNASYKRMKDTALLIRGRFTNAGSNASLASRDGMVSLAESIDSMSDIMRDSLSISEEPLQDSHLLQRGSESRLGREVEDRN